MKGSSLRDHPRRVDDNSDQRDNLLTGQRRRSAKMAVAEKGMLESLKNYPKGVFFMLGNEFCERFSFYGMRAVLTLYLITEHHFSESKASLFYHAFVSLAYFSPLFGSIAADNFFGRFRVILWVSLIYVLGHALLSVGAIPQIEHTIRSILDFGGLVTIALATGGIKPCVSAFAADQFEEDQVSERRQFFSFFYFAINAGSLVAIILTPLLRGRVSCFGSEYCFPLAFGVPGVLMLFAFILFLFGWRFYKRAPAAKGNVVVSVFMCICSAIKNRFTSKKNEKKVEHWVDRASSKYDEELRIGVKSLVGVAALFLPLVFYWALFDQQGSTWVLQARRMDGRVGNLTILPDQMTTFNPLLVLLMVPLFEAFIYPLMNKFFKVTPLRKMAAGGILAALAFVMAGLLQLEVNKTMEPQPASGNVFLVSLNNVSNHQTSLNGQALDLHKKLELLTGIYEIDVDGEGFNVNMTKAGKGYVLGLFQTANGTSHSLITYSCEKSENGRTVLYMILPEESALNGGEFFVVDDWNETVVTETIESGRLIKIQPGIISSPKYTLAYGERCNGKAHDCEFQKPFMAQMGAAHVLHLTEDAHLDIHTVVRPNEVNILWQVPQFLVITMGEVLFSITGLEFSYSQATPNMKSVLQAMWLMTTFFGNIIDMLISGSHVVEEPAMEFFFYAFLLTFVIGIFIVIAMNYTYAEDRVHHDENGAVDHLAKSDVGSNFKSMEMEKEKKF